GLPGPGHADQVVHVEDLAIKEIGGQSRNTLAVRGEHAPALSAQNFPAALAETYPEQTEAWHEGAIGDADVVRGAGTQEVRFKVVEELHALPVAIDAEADA